VALFLEPLVILPQVSHLSQQVHFVLLLLRDREGGNVGRRQKEKECVNYLDLSVVLVFYFLPIFELVSSLQLPNGLGRGKGGVMCPPKT
jgi:hypothetical protein